MHLKTKTLWNVHLSSFFFSCFKKFKCLGDALDSVSFLSFATFEVTTFGHFYNLAQILIQLSIFLLSENCGMWSNISFIM